MKPVTSILITLTLLLAACTSDSDDSSQGTEPNNSSATNDSTDSTSTQSTQEVSEDDLLNPQKQYQRFDAVISAGWKKKTPGVDDEVLSELATDFYKEIYEGFLLD